MRYSFGRIIRLFIWSLLLSSCARTCTESALSDVVLTDPELLIVEIQLGKDVSDPKAPRSDIRVRVGDKNGQALSLLNGGVSANGRALTVQRTLLTKLPYYFADEATIEISDDMTYDISVQLGDGSAYSSLLTLPKGNLTEFDVPADHSSAHELTVNWNKLNGAYDAWLTWEKTMVRDTVSQIVSERMVITPGTTQKKFPASFFQDDEFRVTSVDFTLEVQNRGEVNAHFRAGSFFRSRFFASKRVRVDFPES